LAAAVEPAQRRRRRRRRLVVVITLLTGLWLAREPLFGGLIADLVGWRLTRTLGCEVTIRRVGGTWFGDLRFDDVTVAEPGFGALRSARCRTFHVDWSLSRITDPVSAIDSLRLEGGDIVIAPPPPADGDDRSPSPPPSPRVIAAALPDPLPRIDVRTRVRVVTRRGDITARSMRLHAQGVEARLVIDGLDGDGAFADLATPRCEMDLDLGGEDVVIGGADAIAGIVPRRLAFARSGPERVEAALGFAGGDLTATWIAGHLTASTDGVELRRVPGWVRAVAGNRLPMTGSLSGAVEAEVDADGAWRGSARVDALALVWPELALDRIALELDIAPDGIAVASAEVRGPGMAIDCTDVAWRRDAPLGLSRVGDLRVDVADLAAWLRRLAPEVGARLPTGPLTIAARAQRSGADGVRVEDLHVGIDATRIAFAGDVDLASGSATVTRIAVDDPRGTLSASGALARERDGFSVRIDRAEATAGAAAARLAQPLRLRVDRHGFALENAVIEVGDGRMRIAALVGERVHAQLALSDVEPGPWLALVAATPRLEGRIDLRLEVEGDRATPAAAILASSRALRIDGRPAELLLSAGQDEGGLALEVLRLRMAGAEIAGEGAWPLRLGAGGVVTGGTRPPGLRLDASVPDLGDLAPAAGVDGELALHVSVDAPDGAPRARLALDARRLRPLQDGAERGVAVEEAIDAALAVSVDGAALAAELSLRADQRRFALLDARIDAPSGWAARPQALADAPLAGSLALDAAPLDHLAPWLKPVLRLAGTVTGTIGLGGSLRAPRPEGTLALAGLELRLRGPMGAVAAGAGEIRVAADRVAIERFACLMGGEPAALAGEVRRDDDGAVAFDLRLSGESAALVQSSDVRVRADFTATLTGPLGSPVLGGTVAVTDALLSGDIDVVGRGPGVGDDRFQLFALRGPWAALRFDLRVTGAQSLIVDNNLLDGAFSLDLHLGGTGEAPAPAGLLTARVGTRVKLPFSTLQMQRIELRFREDDPFRPRVDASGTSSFAGQAGSGRIEVRVDASGPYDNVQITTSSEPPLSEDDRLSLLTTGATRSSIEGNPGRRALGIAGGYLFAEVKRWVAGPSNPDADPGFFDRFDLQIGDELSRSGNEVVETEFRLDNRGQWFLAGERDRFDALNTGVIFRLSFK